MKHSKSQHTSRHLDEWPEIDTTVANEARVYDVLLGGTDNFAVDRRAAEAHGKAVGGIENSRHAVRANRRFLGRVVRHLAGEAQIRQFLDLGTGIPTGQNVHQVAQKIRPEARVVYADKDPVVLAHAHTLLASGTEGATDYIRSDMRDVTRVLHQAAATLDLAEPVAVLFVSMLHFIGDDENPHRLVARYLARLAAGSVLVVSTWQRTSNPTPSPHSPSPPPTTTPSPTASIHARTQRSPGSSTGWS